MFPYKKIIAGTGIVVFTIIGIAATKPPEEEVKYKNLKVLSNKVSEDDMERIMYKFNRDLGVGCAYCHVTKRNEFTYTDVDFASDDKREKIISRNMLRMTIRLNKKYFNKKVDNLLRTSPTIWCRTCHGGQAVPRKIQ